MEKHNERERIKEIAGTFIKYGIRDGIKSITNPAHLRMTMEELGPTFIKIGQILSTRPDIMPESYITEFQKLHDNVKPESFTDIERVVEDELKNPIEKIFKSFDKEPVACASMAEVHIARLYTMEKVVVKIQRPKARDRMVSDISILKRMARFLKFTPQGSVINPVEVVDELWNVIEKELDFLNEATNIKRFYDNNKTTKFITCPKVFDSYTTRKVLVMDYIEGIKIANTSMLVDEGYDLEDIALKLANNYIKQVLEDGFFHGDPHPGNIFIAGKKIAYIDFGMMGKLNKDTREKFNSFLYGVATRDIDLMAHTILRIGIKKGNIDNRKLYSDVGEIYNSYIEASLHDINFPQMMDEIIKACRNSNFAMPRDITMLVKGIMTIEGVLAKITPEINIMDVAIPYVKGHMLKNKDFKKSLLDQLETVYTLSRYSLKIPIKLLELMNIAVAGKLKIQMEHTNLEKSVVELHKMINRLVFGLIISALIIGSSLVIRADIGPKIINISAIGFIGYIGAGILGFWLLISIMKSGRI